MQANTPHEFQKIIEEIDRLGIEWTEEAQYDLSKLSKDRRVQVRDAANLAPKEMVTQYIAQMEVSKFPPIVVTLDGWTVDGNTRVEARQARKEKFHPALILQTEYHSAGEKRQAELRALGATLNQGGSQRLTGAEVRRMVADLLALNWKAEHIARSIGASNQQITQVKREIAATKKLEKVGLDPKKYKDASLRALGADKAVNINDVPFKELASLAADAGFTSGEISSTATDMRALSSDQLAIDHVQKLRSASEQRIREHALTGNGGPPASRQLRQHLGFVVKFAGKEEELLEAFGKGAEHAEAIDKAINVLTKLRDMQKAA